MEMILSIFFLLTHNEHKSFVADWDFVHFLNVHQHALDTLDSVVSHSILNAFLSQLGIILTFFLTKNKINSRVFIQWATHSEIQKQTNAKRWW